MKDVIEEMEADIVYVYDERILIELLDAVEDLRTVIKRKIRDCATE